MRQFRIIGVWLLALAMPAVAAAQGDLARARTLYNSGQYEERFRKSADPI